MPAVANFQFRPLEANRNKPDIDIDYRNLKDKMNKIMPGRKGGKKVDMSQYATVKGKMKQESQSQMNSHAMGLEDYTQTPFVNMAPATKRERFTDPHKYQK